MQYEPHPQDHTMRNRDGAKHHDVRQTTWHSSMRSSASRLIRFLISAADPVATSVTFDPWGMEPSGSMDLSNLLPWRAQIPFYAIAGKPL